MLNFQFEVQGKNSIRNFRKKVNWLIRLAYNGDISCTFVIETLKSLRDIEHGYTRKLANTKKNDFLALSIVKVKLIILAKQGKKKALQNALITYPNLTDFVDDLYCKYFVYKVGIHFANTVNSCVSAENLVTRNFIKN